MRRKYATLKTADNFRKISMKVANYKLGSCGFFFFFFE